MLATAVPSARQIDFFSSQALPSLISIVVDVSAMLSVCKSASRPPSTKTIRDAAQLAVHDWGTIQIWLSSRQPHMAKADLHSRGRRTFESYGQQCQRQPGPSLLPGLGPHLQPHQRYSLCNAACWNEKHACLAQPTVIVARSHCKLTARRLALRT